MNLRVGDPVTVLAPAVRKWQGRWQVRRTFVLKISTPKSVPKGMFIAEGVGLLFALRREGVSWIRGHQQRRSKEAQALLTARALID